MTSSATDHPSKTLATFAAELQFADIPAPVLRRTEDLMLDWLGSVLAARTARPIRSIERFAQAMGPAEGPSEILTSRRTSSPLFAAMVNAAASHFVEQDDVHNGSVFHPAAVVIAPALAVAQSLGASGAQLLTAVVAGYEVGIRVGEFLGRSHYKTFHTTATAGTLAAAAAVGRLLDLTPQQMLHAFGSAGTQSAGVWEFLRDAADSKQLHCAHAASSGPDVGLPRAGRLHRRGQDPRRRARPGRGHVERCRPGKAHRWPGHALDAGRDLVQVPRLVPPHAPRRRRAAAGDDAEQARTRRRVARDHARAPGRHRRAGPRDGAGHGAPGQVLDGHGAGPDRGARRAGLGEFDRDFVSTEVCAFREKVAMQLDDEVDAAYPARWIGKVSVHTTDGRTLQGRVDEPKGDPGNSLSRAEIEDKMQRLAHYGEGATADEAKALCERVWQLEATPRVGRWLG
jgi:2-methylcitrate dehydratase PrpD